MVSREYLKPAVFFEQNSSLNIICMDNNNAFWARGNTRDPDPPVLEN